MGDVKVKVLEEFNREVALRRKWMCLWEQLGKRILKLPRWMQTIILEDVNTAVTNRLATMEMIQNAQKNH